jgi:hypothetical protein
MMPFGVDPESGRAVFRAEMEREYQKASLRRLVREARKARRAQSYGTWISRMIRTLAPHFQRSTDLKPVREPLPPQADC